MLPSKVRLSLRREPTFFTHAQRVHEALFTCWYTKSEKFVAAITVSKKVSPHATDRNLLKRRVRSILTQLRSSVPVKTVWVMKKAALDIPQSVLANRMEKVLDTIRHEISDSSTD